MIIEEITNLIEEIRLNPNKFFGFSELAKAKALRADRQFLNQTKREALRVAMTHPNPNIAIKAAGMASQADQASNMVSKHIGKYNSIAKRKLVNRFLPATALAGAGAGTAYALNNGER